MRRSARIVLLVIAIAALGLAVSGASVLADQGGPGLRAPVADQAGPGL